MGCDLDTDGIASVSARVYNAWPIERPREELDVLPTSEARDLAASDYVYAPLRIASESRLLDGKGGKSDVFAVSATKLPETTVPRPADHIFARAGVWGTMQTFSNGGMDGAIEIVG